MILVLEVVIGSAGGPKPRRAARGLPEQGLVAVRRACIYAHSHQGPITHDDSTGRPTLCSPLEAIGEGYYPAGTQSFSCVIDWGPSSLLIDVVDWGTTDFDASLDVLDMFFASIAPLTPLPPPSGG